jgi:hypothetical protein
MKILVDPIYSAKPSHCASAMKAKRIIEHTLVTMKREDIFFRVLVPKNLEQEEIDWFPKHPNVLLVEYPYNKDRMIEYQRFTLDYEDKVAFNGLFWDNDVVITMRTQQVPNIQITQSSVRQKAVTWLKKVLVYEEMPVMSFKPTVAVSNETVQDMATVLGYLTADKTFITIQHEKDGILDAARKFLAPRKVQELMGKIMVTSPVRIDKFEIKREKYRFVRGQRPFCLGFTGRMTNSMSRLETVYETAEKHWILKGDKGFRMVFSTVTKGIKMAPPEFCEVVHLPRDEFWKLIRSELDLVICMDTDAGFGMSFFEPILFGTPMIVADEPWSRALLGDKYPFYAKGMQEAYAFVGAFHDNYEKMHQAFSDWQQTELKARFSIGGQYQWNLYDALYAQIETFEKQCLDRYSYECPNKKYNDIVLAVLAKVEGQQEFVLHEVLKDLADDGTLESLGRKLGWTRQSGPGIVWDTPWNDFRVILKVFYGWEDASPVPGHLRRAEAWK